MKLPIVELKKTKIEVGDIIIFHQDQSGLNPYCTGNVVNLIYTDVGEQESVVVSIIKPGISAYRLNSRPLIKFGEDNAVYGQIVPVLEQTRDAKIINKPNPLVMITNAEVDHALDMLYKALGQFNTLTAPTSWCLDYIKELNLMPYTGKRAGKALNTWIRNDERFDIKGGYVRAVPLEVAKQRRKAKVALGTPEEPERAEFPMLNDDERYVDVTKVMQGFMCLVESGLLGKLIPVNIPKDVKS